MDITSIGRWLLNTGTALVALGLVLVLAGRVSGIGRLPGDIVVQRDGFTFYFPLATAILLSVLLTIAPNIIGRILAR